MKILCLTFPFGEDTTSGLHPLPNSLGSEDGIIDLSVIFGKGEEKEKILQSLQIYIEQLLEYHI